MSQKLTLRCPHCNWVLYELEEQEPFVAAGMCGYCKKQFVFNPDKSLFVKAGEE